MRIPLVPSYRPEVAKGNFMKHSRAPEESVYIGEIQVLTRPLALNEHGIDLIAISSDIELMRNGKCDISDRVFAESLRIAKLYDVDSRGNVLVKDVSELPEAVFVQEGDVWVVNIRTEIEGIACSFEATFHPQNNMIYAKGSIWGYALEGVRGQ